MVATGAETIGTAAAARRLSISEGRVRQLADAGVLPFTRSPHGRLFDISDVDVLIAERFAASVAPRVRSRQVGRRT
jgi:excisionase family DNA binding protein